MLVMALAAASVTVFHAGPAFAEPSAPTAAPSSPSSVARSPADRSRGVAVVAIGAARQEAFTLARAVYASRLRPPSLDEVRARAVAGAPVPANATRELRELADVRAALTGDDAPSRSMLTGIARQLGVEALLVVSLSAAPASDPPARPSPDDPGAPSSASPSPVGGDAVGAVGPAEGAAASGELAAAPVAGDLKEGPAPAPTPVARLFLVDAGTFDAARYLPDEGGAWAGTVASLEPRFGKASPTVGAQPVPAALGGVPRGSQSALDPETEKQSSRPFYAKGWFWGAVGGALLLGAGFYLASRDTSGDTIQLDMKVPR